MWPLGEFFDQTYPMLDATTGEPIFQPSTPTIGNAATYSATWQRFDGVFGSYPLNGGRIYIEVPQDETWDVTVSFDLNRFTNSAQFFCLLASGNPGYPGTIVDQFIASTDPLADSAERVTLSGQCTGTSALIFLVDRTISMFVDNFAAEGTFAAPYTVPPWVLGSFSNTIVELNEVPNPPDPDSGLPIIQTTNSLVPDSRGYNLRSVRVDPNTPILGAVEDNGVPVVFKQLDLDIPPGEIWNIRFSANIDRINETRVANVTIMPPWNGNVFTQVPLAIFSASVNPAADPLIPTSEAFEITAQVTSESYFGFMVDARGGVDINLIDSSGVFVSSIVPEEPTFQITWWEPGSKTYERGIDRGVLYFDDGRVVPWNGLTKVDEQFGITSEAVYFDGIKLSDVPTNEGFSAQISAITYPDQLEEAYGNLELRNGIYLGEQAQKSFGFSYRNKVGTELDEDAGYKIHLVYNVTALPSSRSYETIDDDLNLTEFSWDFSTTPETVTGYQASAHVVLDTTELTPSLLVEIENILYGTADSAPYLPPLSELIDLISGFDNFINITDNGDGTWTASTAADGYINDLGGGVVEIQEATIQINGPTSYLISPTPDPPAI